MYVVKMTGEREEFNSEKIKGTCLKAGCSEILAEKIAKQVETKAYNGIPTREILRITLELLHKEMPLVAARYDLKGSIFRLGPAGFAFEHFMGDILRRNGYKTKIEAIVRGGCVAHEIDVTAIKGGKTYMIECKYHNIPGVFTGLREVLYTYARFLDLQEGYEKGLCQKFDVPWLACNTKFSEEAIRYAECKGIMLTGWNYPENNGLERLIEDKKLYPITMLKNLDRESRDRLASTDMILLKDLLEVDIRELHKITDIKISKLSVLVEEAKGIQRLK